jgi:elongation factor 1-beta
VVRTKIMPKEAEVKPNAILQDLKSKDPNLEIRSSREEPIAFGVVALIADFLISDESGQMERLENLLRSSDRVGEFEILGASRLSTRLK